MHESTFFLCKKRPFNRVPCDEEWGGATKTIHSDRRSGPTDQPTNRLWREAGKPGWQADFPYNHFGSTANGNTIDCTKLQCPLLSMGSSSSSGTAGGTRYTHQSHFNGSQKGTLYICSRPVALPLGTGYLLPNVSGVHHFLLVNAPRKTWVVHEWGTDGRKSFATPRLGWRTNKCSRVRRGNFTLDQVLKAAKQASRGKSYSVDNFSCNHWVRAVLKILGWKIIPSWRCVCVAWSESRFATKNCGVYVKDKLVSWRSVKTHLKMLRSLLILCLCATAVYATTPQVSKAICHFKPTSNNLNPLLWGWVTDGVGRALELGSTKFVGCPLGIMAGMSIYVCRYYYN